MTITVHSAVPRELDAATLYRILQLRVAVFVVEQACAYPELDGRDLEPGAVWVWAAEGPEVVATLRILTDPDGRSRIGRVATSAGYRSRGVASRLILAARELIGDVETVLDAQADQQGFYERLGFHRCGPDFVEDGIAHLPMSDRMPNAG